MMRYEWKKLLLRRKGFLLILLFLAAELTAMLLFTQPYDTVLEDNRAVYEIYLAQVEGPLTQEKREYLESEMDRLNTVHQELEQLKSDYYSGKVTEEEYRTSFETLAVDDGLYTGFSRLYSQYIYVRESDNRSFLYTGGWEVLLTDPEPDYLFLLTLILILTPIFCGEYRCRMHEILLTQKRSAQYQVHTKVGVAVILTAVLTALLQFFDLAFCAAKFGLANGSFSLQSLYSFGSTAKELTLWQSFWLQFLLKEIGYLYVAILVLCLSVLLKKFALTLTASIAVLILPLLTVESADVFLKIPGPWALTIGNGYLKGGSIELTWAELGLLLMGVGAILGAMLYTIGRRNTNWQMRKSFLKTMLMLCITTLVLTGCTKRQEGIIFNRSTSNIYETDDYFISGSTLMDKATGNSFDFPLSALEGAVVTCGSSFFGVGDTVYYLKTTTHQPSAGWDTISTDCDLIKLDLASMEESVVYQWNGETDWFFGLLDLETAEPNPATMELLFIHENHLYYADISTSGICRMDLLTGQYGVILDNLNSQDIAYDGCNLYYLDSYNRLVTLNLSSGKARAVDEVVAGAFLLAPEGIYFQNRRDGEALYLWNKAEGTIAKVNDASAATIYENE